MTAVADVQVRETNQVTESGEQPKACGALNELLARIDAAEVKLTGGDPDQRPGVLRPSLLAAPPRGRSLRTGSRPWSNSPRRIPSGTTPPSETALTH